MTFETKDAEKYVSEHLLDKKYEVLSNSGIMEEFLKSSLIERVFRVRPHCGQPNVNLRQVPAQVNE